MANRFKYDFKIVLPHCAGTLSHIAQRSVAVTLSNSRLSIVTTSRPHAFLGLTGLALHSRPIKVSPAITFFDSQFG